MKKALLFLLAFVILLALTACTAKDYEEAVSLYDAGEFAAAQNIFETIPDYEDSGEYLKLCGYQIEAAEFLACIDSLVTEGGTVTATIEDAAEVERAEELYANLSNETKEFLGPTYEPRVGLAREWLVGEVQNAVDDAIDMIEAYDMIGAYERLDAVRDYASDSKEMDQVELIAHCHELIQTACYPDTLIPKLPLVSALPMSDLITSTQEDFDGYSIFKYYYKNSGIMDKSKADSDGYDGGLTNLLEDTFTIGTLSAEDGSTMIKLMDGSSYVKLRLEETNDLVGFVPTYSSVDRTVNDIDFGGQSQYRRYIIETVLIIYGDKELDFLTPKEPVVDSGN